MSDTALTTEQSALLSTARMMLLRRMAYYGIFLIGVPVYVDRSIPTAQTNFTSIRFNPEFCLGGEGKRPKLRRVGETIFIKAHEVLHMTFKHGIRMGFRHPGLWNIACDFAINLILVDGRIGEYPDRDINPRTGAPYPMLVNEAYRGMSAETIYDIKLAELKAQGGGHNLNINGVIVDLRDVDPGGLGGFVKPVNLDGSDLTEAQKRALERSLNSRASAAAASAKSQGMLPMGLEILLGEALKGEVDWREVLRGFVARTIQTDLTWNRPRKRHLWRDIYLPTIEWGGVGKMVACMDTSGSVDYSGPRSEGGRYFSELNSLHEECQPEEFHIMYADAEIHGHDVFYPGDTMVLKPKGRGGTDFRPFFKRVEEEGIDPQCAIYLTDMWGTFPDNPPGYPVLWVATTDVVAPWGETVRIMKAET